MEPVKRLHFQQSDTRISSGQRAQTILSRHVRKVSESMLKLVSLSNKKERGCIHCRS